MNSPESFNFNPHIGEFVPSENFTFNQQASEFVPVVGLCDTEQTSHLQEWGSDPLLCLNPQTADYLPTLPGWSPEAWNDFNPQASEFVPNYQASDLEHACCMDEQLDLGHTFNMQALEFMAGHQASGSGCAYQEQLAQGNFHYEDHGNLTSQTLCQE